MAPDLAFHSNMCSTNRVVKLRREWDKKRQRWTCVEAWCDTSCPGCHQPYRGGHVHVGWLPCACLPTFPDESGHRTLHCRDCGFEVFLPPHRQQHGPHPAR